MTAINKLLGINKKTLPPIVVTSLLSVVGLLTQQGIPYKIAFALVFTIFDFLALSFIKIRLTQIYGDSRAIKLFVYGFGGVALLVFILMLFGIGSE